MQMHVLGTLVDNECSPKTSLNYRLLKAERVFQKRRAVLCGKGSPGQKLPALESTALNSAAYGTGTNPLTREQAHQVHSWENRHLRLVLRLRPWAQELDEPGGYVMYVQRSARFIDYMKTQCLRPSLVHLCFDNIFVKRGRKGLARIRMEETASRCYVTTVVFCGGVASNQYRGAHAKSVGGYMLVQAHLQDRGRTFWWRCVGPIGAPLGILQAIWANG